MKVRNMESPRTGNPVANQFIIEDGGKVYFQSYDTIIAVKKSGKITLDKNLWNCSRTTSKYRNEFTGFNTKETKEYIREGKVLLADLNK